MSFEVFYGRTEALWGDEGIRISDDEAGHGGPGERVGDCCAF